MSDLTHFDKDGNARMVDVTDKEMSNRVAIATGRINMQADTLQKIIAGQFAKGDVLQVARLAGIMAAKRTSDLIPLCHPLALTSVTVDLTANSSDSTVDISATVRLTGRTGVEMEALTAVSVAALTVYDMCKAVDRGMCISAISLKHKSGGKSGTFDADDGEAGR